LRDNLKRVASINIGGDACATRLLKMYVRTTPSTACSGGPFGKIQTILAGGNTMAMTRFDR